MLRICVAVHLRWVKNILAAERIYSDAVNATEKKTDLNFISSYAYYKASFKSDTIVLFMTFYVQKSDTKVRSKLKSTLLLHCIWHIKKTM